MVTACKGAFLRIKKLQHKKRVFFKLFFSPDLDESFKVPADYWVIKVRGKNAYMTGKEDDNEESLLAFSSKNKAKRFLKKIGWPLSRYCFFHFCWQDLVREFKGTYKYVRIDERVSNKFSLFMPLK